MEERKRIREVVLGEKGLLLAKTEYHQKYHIVTKDSEVQPGDFVEAMPVRDAEKYTLYKCVTIPVDRMVVEIITPRGCSNSAVYHWNGEEESAGGYFKTAEIEPHIGMCTGHSSIHICRGGTFGGYRRLALIKKDEEKAVHDVFIKSQFNYFVLEGMGIWNLHTNGPRFEYKKELRTYKDFENAWRKYDYLGHQKVVGILGPNEGHRSTVFTHEEWEVLVPHLAAWTDFVRMVRNYYDYICEHQPPEIWQFCFTMSGRANAYYCLTPLLEKAAEEFRRVENITKENVIRFLAKTKSVFPTLSL